MDIIEQLFHVLERAVAVGLVIAIAFGAANFFAGVIVTLRRGSAPSSQQH